jgi:hypothetical protein
MNPAEILVHAVKCDCCTVIANLFTEAIYQASKAAHAHSHCKILAFHVRRADVFLIRLTVDDWRIDSNALCGAVPRLFLYRP